jgi:DNA replicative helicase MCM subunit Mcm2 (Cdc46/Mcm family)
MAETVHIFCESCGATCEVVFDREDDLQDVVFCPFCGEESLEEELIDPDELEDDFEEVDDDDDVEEDDED